MVAEKPMLTLNTIYTIMIWKRMKTVPLFIASLILVWINLYQIVFNSNINPFSYLRNYYDSIRFVLIGNFDIIENQYNFWSYNRRVLCNHHSSRKYFRPIRHRIQKIQAFWESVMFFQTYFRLYIWCGNYKKTGQFLFRIRKEIFLFCTNEVPISIIFKYPKSLSNHVTLQKSTVTSL